LSLVSKHFRHIAAQQLYRNFCIVFPDDDHISFESPIDSLASHLDTFATSEYNYAAYLRNISLDTLLAGTRAERAYSSYLYKESCGKFLNTLLVLTLRKAQSLETFRCGQFRRQLLCRLQSLLWLTMAPTVTDGM
jgi:hypothetical protein